MDFIEENIKDSVSYIKLNNPQKMNCLSSGLCLELIEALHNAYDKKCKAVSVSANANRNVWSAGHDIRELPTDNSDPLEYSVPMERLLRLVQMIPIPVVACVDGTVWGGA
ncbi:MAG: enoyl-CoA hydratase/isomerase family protein, partial [Opitutales bacterium]|nr:enoyl-CoA hydratase/isomerase family protein [Opitutales bacterium]